MAAGEVLTIVRFLPKNLKSEHKCCLRQYCWLKDDMFFCAYCLKDGGCRVSVLCAINCSTDNQNLFGHRKDNFVKFAFAKRLVGPVEVFDNYGQHTGHVGCRQPV